jgi:hypothetical protein
LKKSFDAVVFDVLKVTPEEYAVSLLPLPSPVFVHDLLIGSIKLVFEALMEIFFFKLNMGIVESSMIMEQAEDWAGGQVESKKTVVLLEAASEVRPSIL